MEFTQSVQNERGETYEIDQDGFLVDGVVVTLSLSDIINTDLEGFLDLLTERSGFPLLCEPEYKIIGFSPIANTLTFRVKGDVSMGIEGSES